MLCQAYEASPLKEGQFRVRHSDAPILSIRIGRAPVVCAPLHHVCMSRLLGQICGEVVPQAVVRSQPLQLRQVSLPSSRRARTSVAGAAVGPIPLQHLEMSPSAANEYIHSSQGASLAVHHCSTAECPPSATYPRACTFHGKPFSLHHCTAVRCPP